jgi:hypothetical protein
MPAPFDYNIQRPDIMGAIGAYEAGRDRNRQMMQQNKQDMFAQYLPGALKGDQQALQGAQQNATPEQQMQLQNALAQMEDRQLQQTLQQQEKFARLAQWADTPQKWTQATQMAEAEGLQGAAQIPFEQRGAKLAGMLSVKDQLDQEWKRREFALQERNVNSQIGARNAAGSGGSGVFNTAAQRAQLAQAYGIDPKSPAGQKFVLTGQLPASMSPTDKKAILEADQMVMASQQGLGMLNQAKTLSPKAAGGFGMGTLADIFAQIGDETALNTRDLENILQSNVLPQLKVIFGGAPTEGERQILLDLQGSASKTVEERRRIIDRAIAAANARIGFYRAQAADLRGGTYYSPTRGQPQPPAGADGWKIEEVQ